MTTEENHVQSDLRFLLPLRNAESVAVIGHSPTLAATIRRSGLCCNEYRFDSDPSAIPPAGIDHILMLSPPSGLFETWGMAAARALNSGGHLFIGISLSSGQRIAAALGRGFLRAAERTLTENGLRIESRYGVHERLTRPRYLVPLETAGPARHLFERMLPPYTRTGAFKRFAAVGLSRVGLQVALFRDIGIVARRPPRGKRP